MVSLSKTISGLVILTVLVGGMLIFLTDGVTTYNANVPSGYNDSFQKIRNNLDDLAENANKTRDSLNINADANTNNPFTDFLGFIFNSGYQAALVARTSVEVGFSIADESVDQVFGATEFGGLLKMAAGTLILVFITITILLAFIIKSGRE
jgi:hypothetical protein